MTINDFGDDPITSPDKPMFVDPHEPGVVDGLRALAEHAWVLHELLSRGSKDVATGRQPWTQKASQELDAKIRAIVRRLLTELGALPSGRG